MRMTPPQSETPDIEATPALVLSSFGFLYPSEDQTVDALDLDERASTRDDFVPADGCPHDDFEGGDGQSDVDHQFLRVTDTYESLRAGGIADQIIGSAVKNGSMTVLVTQDATAVRVFMAQDRPLTGNDGEVVADGTFRAVPDPLYHADLGAPIFTDEGFVAGPADIRLKMNIQIVEADLYIRDAYLSVEIGPDGRAVGRLQGYWEIDGIIEILASTPAHLAALGYTLEAFRDTLDTYADGQVDEMGRCDALSAAFRVEAVPAFMTSASTP